MKENEFRNQLNAVVPEMPESFDQAMRRTLEGIVARESAEAGVVRPERTTSKRRYAGGLKKRTLAYILIAALLLAAVAVAATVLRHSVFEVTLGAEPVNGAKIMQYDLAKVSFDECDVEIKQAAYDGMSLFVVYSIRDRNAVEPLGEVDETGVRRGEYTFPAMERDDVGWWFDALWIDGEDTSMPGMSGGDTICSETPGELLFYMIYRLDQEDVYLTGKNVEIAMPIGKRQDFDTFEHDPETGKIVKPEKGLVTFTLDCSQRDGVSIEQPNVELAAENFTAKVSEVTYTPIQTYVTLDIAVKPEALAKYIEENGEGYYDENGVLLWKYDGMEVVDGWASELVMVDKEGKPVFETMEGYYGCQGWGATVAWYTFPYKADLPEEIYLAPKDRENGTVDMTMAVKLR